MASLRWLPLQLERVANGQYHHDLREPRLGVMLHYDDSKNDRGSVAWFGDPRCKVSYHWLVLDDGSYVGIAPLTARAWHAGVCRPSEPRLQYGDANSAFVGIAAATDGNQEVTALQLLTIAVLTREVFAYEGWSLQDLWRIVGHDTEAWPRGRKMDPTGPQARNAILSVTNVRQLVPLLEEL